MSKDYSLFRLERGLEVSADKLKNVNERSIVDLIDKIRSLFPKFGDISSPNEGQTGGSPNTVIPLGVQAVYAKKMWNKGIDGKGVLVGVIDTGITNHPDLKSNIKVRRNYTIEFFEPKAEHGTHVAGTIAANGKLKGVAPGAYLADYRVLTSLGTGSNLNVVKAVYDAVKDGCHVINMSLGGSQNDPALQQAINHAYSKGVVVIAAAGNEGDGNDKTDEISYPASNDHVFSVGSINYSDPTKPSKFSNSNKYVDCCCHGERVLSTAPKGKYIELTGTSMACPHVAGVAALIISEGLKAGKRLDADEVYEKLKKLTVDVNTKGYDNSTGYGFVTFRNQ